MSGAGPIEPPPIRAALLVHQEGMLALIAVVGLSFSEHGLAAGLRSIGPMTISIAVGVGAALVCVGTLWSLRWLAPLRRLEHWQRRVVAGWSTTDAVLVALMSGLAEEALLRAFLQPVIGLIPAAALFAMLHLVPDRSLWFWPVFALVTGVILGALFERFGYPAAAAAHVVINLVALLRLRRAELE